MSDASKRVVEVPIPQGEVFDHFTTDQAGNTVVVTRREVPELGPFRPGIDQLFWRNISTGYDPLSAKVDEITTGFARSQADRFNTYATEKHARVDAAHELSARKLRRFAHELNPEGWQANSGEIWEICTKVRERGKVLPMHVDVPALGGVHFHSKEAAQRALDALTTEDIAALQKQY